MEYTYMINFQPQCFTTMGLKPIFKKIHGIQSYAWFPVLQRECASHLLHGFSYYALPILISFSSNVLRDMMIRSFRVCLLCDLVFLTLMVVLLTLQWRTIKLADVFLASRVVLRIFQWRTIKPADRWSTQVQWRTLNNPVLLLLRQ